MTGRYDQNYGNEGGNSGSNYDDTPTLTMSAKTAIEGAITNLGQFDKYGRSLIVNIDDVEVLDGILMEKTTDSDKLKLFSWEQFGFERDEDGVVDVEEDEIPNRQSINAGGDTHTYQLLDSAVEGADGHLGESVFVGDATMFISGTSKGRSLVDHICADGKGARNADDDEKWNDDYDWLKEDVAELRPELEGREIELFFKPISYTKENDDGEEEERSYNVAVLIDSKTGEVIKTVDSEEEVETETDTNPASGEVDGSEDLPDGVQRVRDLFIDKAKDGEEPSEQTVENMLDTQTEEDDIDEYVQDIVSDARAIAT